MYFRLGLFLEYREESFYILNTYPSLIKMANMIMYIRVYLFELFVDKSEHSKKAAMDANVLGNFELFRAILTSKFAKYDI